LRNKRILREIIYIKTKLVELNNSINEIKTPTNFNFNPDNVNKLLLSLPDNMRLTFSIVLNLKEVTASDVSSLSKRVRAVESSILNQLVRMGFLKKKRKSKMVIFYI